MILHLDFETRSEVNLKRTGVYVYAEHPSTKIWCACYAVDDGPVQTWQPGEPPPAELEQADLIVAHNANFERIIWRHVLPAHDWPQVPRLQRWRCTMAAALAMALPADLADAAAAAGLEQGKDMQGKRVMLQMAKPRKARKGESEDEVRWYDDAKRLERLIEYCRQDVETERQLHKRLLALRPEEQQLWRLDQVINDRGVQVDRDLCRAAVQVVDQATEWLDQELMELTDAQISSATNAGRFVDWLCRQGYSTGSADKENIDKLLLQPGLPIRVRRVLEIRREGAQASVKKIAALLEGASEDGRARGLLQFHAASTGRWAGRRFQPQNIKRPSSGDDDIELMISDIATGDAQHVRMAHGEPISIVADCLRGMVVAASGCRLLAADFSNIEGRIAAWLSGEQWKVKAFNDFDKGQGPDVYKLAYSRAFNMAANAVSKDQRQVGKVMELALGFQGGVRAFQRMAALYRVEVSDERADELKKAWRAAHPGISKFWYALEDAAKWAIWNPGKPVKAGKVSFLVNGSFLFMRLPSGRSISYPYACIKDKETPWGEMRPQVSYMGVNSYTRKWESCFAHGGLLFENAVSGSARDVLAEAMVRVESAGYPIVLTVHDEIVCEARQEFGGVAQFESLMTTAPKWADGLPIAAKAWEGKRYRKD